MPRSILVVDDHQAIRTVLVELLHEEGYRVRAAVDGLAGLRAIAREPPDLVVSDVMMPKIDGVSLATRLQGLGIPVVLLSAVYDDVDLPGVRFLPKPFAVDDLLWVIARTFEDHARTQRQAVVRGPFTKWRG